MIVVHVVFYNMLKSDKLDDKKFKRACDSLF